VRRTIALLLVLVLAASSIVAFLSVKAEHKTIVVPDDYSTIQEAIDSANAGDIVYVRKGTYSFIGDNDDVIRIDKPLSLIGEDSQKTIIEPLSVGAAFMMASAIRVQAENVTISGFKIYGLIQNLTWNQLTGDMLPADHPLNKPVYGYISLGFGVIVERNASNCRIIGNDISHCYYSSINAEGDKVFISENNIISNLRNGIELTSSHSIVSKNNISQNSRMGIIINPYPTDLENKGKNITIIENIIKENGQEAVLPHPYGGLEINGQGPWYIHGNNIKDNIKIGIRLSGNRNGSVISGNIIDGNHFYGLRLDSCQNVIVKDNIISSNGWAASNYYEDDVGGLIFWIGANNIRAYENNITDNRVGVKFCRSFSGSKVYKNNIMHNDLGINLLEDATGGLGNKVYCNNIIDNTQNVLVQQNVTDVVLWDNGYVGNYWSDYQLRYPNAAEVDASGIGDTPYVIDENNKDRYPLFELLRFEPLEISVLSPLAQTYNETSVPLIFTIRGKWVNWTGYSLDGKETITVTDNTTLTGLLNGSHNVTVYAKDLVDAEASDTVWFNVAEPFPVVPVAAVSVAVVAVVSAGLLVYFKKRKH
jgi:parallel beta-helix repeat protein